MRRRKIQAGSCVYDLATRYFYALKRLMRLKTIHIISFPLISSSIFGGNFENPVAESTRQCIRAYKQFVEDFPDYEVDVKLCAFTGSEMEKAKKEFDAQMDVIV